MISALRILIKTQVREFYTINAGYFLFFFFLFFGVVEPGSMIFYHKSIMLGMFNAPAFLGLVMVVWLLYNLKCIFFCSKQFTRPGNNYLINLQAFSPGRQLGLFSVIQTLLYLPVLIYSCFVVALAIIYDHAWLAF